MIIDNQLLTILIAYFAINFIAFIIMLVDKIKSTQRGAERISEGTLFFMAAAFGAIGVYLGMFTFRHKTKKFYFLIGIPLIIIQNAALVYVIYLFLQNNI